MGDFYSPCFPLSVMVSDVQQVVAVWAVLTIPFVLFGTHLWSQDDLGIRFIVAYWFPAVVLTLTGAIPPPWQLFTG